MGRILLVALAVVAALIDVPEAHANLTPACAQMRNSIIQMEKRITSGASLPVDLQMRALYQKDCLDSPIVRPSDPWFDVDGKPASGPPPQGNGVFQAIPAIADYCRTSGNPALCATMLGLGEGKMLEDGVDPKDSDPSDWHTVKRPIDPADELPGLDLVTADRAPIAIPAECLAELEARLFGGDGGLRDRLRARLASKGKCGSVYSIPDEAIAELQSAARQWQIAALSDPTIPTAVKNTNTSSGAATYTPQEPGFLEMCSQASQYSRQCAQRSANMSTAGSAKPSLRDDLRNRLANKNGTDDTPRDLGKPANPPGQKSAFDDCTALYDSVLKMCRQAGWVEPKVQKAALPAKQGAPRAPKAKTPSDPLDKMSAQCRALLNNYASSAQAHDGAAAYAGYQAVQSTCPNELKQFAQAHGIALPDMAPPASDPRFGNRGDTPMIDQVAVPCDQNPAACNAAVAQLRAGTSPEAAAAVYMNAINTGLELATAMMQVMSAAQALDAAAHPSVPTGGSDMSSLAAPIIRSPPGQGHPLRPPPPNNQSTITGTIH